MQLICFASADPLRDLLLPVHLRADAVRLLSGPGYKAQSERLARCLSERGIEVQMIDWVGFEDCSDHQGEVISRLGSALEAAGEREVVLALGQAAGAWELVTQRVLRDLLGQDEFRVMALTRDSRSAVVLEPGPVRPETVEVDLTPPDYLAACNATLRQSASDEGDRLGAMRSRRAVTLDMARHCDALGPALGTLNYLSHRALDNAGEQLVDPKQVLPFDAASPLRRALTGMVDAGLLDFDGERELIFRSVDACRYIGGGWLEEYAWLTATELGADQVHTGLELTWNAGAGISPRNELDLFVLHGNRALTVECKAGFMGEGDDTAKILYKLDSIADRLSTLPGNAALLSAREVPELIIKRALSQGTAVFDAERLTDFQRWLKAWLAGRLPA